MQTTIQNQIRAAAETGNTDSAVLENIVFNESDPVPAFFHLHAGGAVRFSRTARLPARSFPCPLFFYLDEGSVTFLLLNGENESKRIRLTDGDFLLLPPQSPFKFLIEKIPSSGYAGCFQGDAWSAYEKQLFSDEDPVFTCQSENSRFSMMKEKINQLDNFYKHPFDTVPFYIHQTLTDLMTSCILLQQRQLETDRQQMLTYPKHVQQMLTMFDNNYQLSWRLEDLEDTLGINRFRLNRDFSKAVGQPPLQYLNGVRINQAKLLLAQDDTPVHLIGEKVGIPNTNNFIRLFEKYTGTTPARYRKSLDLYR